MIAAWVVVEVPGGALTVVARAQYKRMSRTFGFVSSHRTRANAVAAMERVRSAEAAAAAAAEGRA